MNSSGAVSAAEGVQCPLHHGDPYVAENIDVEAPDEVRGRGRIFFPFWLSSLIPWPANEISRLRKVSLADKSRF